MNNHRYNNLTENDRNVEHAVRRSSNPVVRGIAEQHWACKLAMRGDRECVKTGMCVVQGEFNQENSDWQPPQPTKML